MLRMTLVSIAVSVVIPGCARPHRIQGTGSANAPSQPEVNIQPVISSDPMPQGTPAAQGGSTPSRPPAQSPQAAQYPQQNPPQASQQNSGVVEFRIPAGTGASPWNTEPLIIKMPPSGQVTLRIINDDTTGHILHTNGYPCPHGNPFVPLAKGASYDCVIRGDFDSVNDPGSFHDHLYGDGAAFRVRTQRL